MPTEQVLWELSANITEMVIYLFGQKTKLSRERTLLTFEAAQAKVSFLNSV